MLKLSPIRNPLNPDTAKDEINMVMRDGRTIPSRKHLETCERLGIPVSPTMSNRDVYLMIQKAIEKPRFKALYDELERERAAAAAAEERAELGDELFGALERWRNLCDVHKHYAVVFRQGKTIKWDILEFEDVTSDESRVSSIRVAVLAPKRRKDRDIGEYLEWEKEIKLKPENILEVQALPKQVDNYDVAAYEKLLAVCAGWAARFERAR